MGRHKRNAEKGHVRPHQKSLKHQPEVTIPKKWKGEFKFMLIFKTLRISDCATI